MSKNTQSPEFFSGKSIPRNMLCPCNSGKKYKKCCFHNKLFEKPILSVIQGKHIRGMEDDVLFRVSYKELPTEFVEKIDNWLEKNKIFKQGCWGNSHILALSKDIDGIDVVNGYYGFTLKDGIKNFGTKFKDEEDAIQKLTHNSQFLKQPDKDKGILRVPDGSSYDDRNAWRDGYLDLNTRVLWMRHSWNKIVGAGDKKKGVGKDIHFDLTTEFDKRHKNIWTYLNEVETFSSGSIKDVEMLKEKYTEELEDMVDTFESGETDNINPNYQESSTPFPNPYPTDKEKE
jgi:hypothetical protein